MLTLKVRHLSGMQELDQYLGAYPFDTYKKWISLTNHITKTIMQRLQPHTGQISSVTQIPTSENYKERANIEVNEKSMNIALEQTSENKINFTEIPTKKYPDGCSPAEITKHSLDSSYVLDCIMQNMHGKIFYYTVYHMFFPISIIKPSAWISGTKKQI